MTDQSFGMLAAFRSRQQAMHFASAMRQLGAATSAGTTPSRIAAGCGISIRFGAGELSKARSLLRSGGYGSLIGIFKADEGYRRVGFTR